MNKLKTPEDFQKFRKELSDNLSLKKAKSNIEIRVAMATCSIATGSRPVIDFFNEELEKRGINASVIPTGCMGYCFAEPTVQITLPGKSPVVFGYVDTKKADLIIEKYIKTGELVDGLLPLNYEII